MEAIHKSIVKPGKEGINEASKYRRISLLNVDGKVLEKLLIESTTIYTQTAYSIKISMVSCHRKAQLTLHWQLKNFRRLTYNKITWR